MKSRFLPKIEVLAEDYEIPQLGKKRRICALLPYNYHSSSKRYPVLYLQDGQTLFNEEAPFGNWAVDRSLAGVVERQKGNLIVIAIDHAEEERINEFSPFRSSKLGKGEGKQYLHFLANTLKPYVDKHFRTLPGRASTGIGGSSMGGLISIYAGLMRPEMFGKLMIFSPSLWISPNIYWDAVHFMIPFPMDIYLYAGGEESANMLPSIRRLKNILEKKGMDFSAINFYLSIDPKGRHSEAFWGAEFPKAVKWLFFNSDNQLAHAGKRSRAV